MGAVLEIIGAIVFAGLLALGVGWIFDNVKIKDKNSK